MDLYKDEAFVREAAAIEADCGGTVEAGLGLKSYVAQVEAASPKALRRQRQAVKMLSILLPELRLELVGYLPELLNLFSTHRQQIESLVALWEAEGRTLFSQNGRVLRSRLAMYEAAALKSRKRKPTPMQPKQLRRGWNALVQIKGLALPELPSPQNTEKRTVERSVNQTTPPAATNLEATADFDVRLATQHCSEREAVFKRTALERFVFEHQLGHASFDQLQQAIEGSAELIQIDENRMTTQAAIQLELETIRLCARGKAR